MTRRRVLLLVALVTIAGCAWPGGDDRTPSRDVVSSVTATAPTTEPDTPTASPTPTDGSATVVTVTPTNETQTATPSPTNETPSATFVTDGEPLATVSLEVADNRTERIRGLMDRETLPAGHGMLFVFGSEESRRFWMKNTTIPLDMIFVDANRTVLNVEHAAVQPNATNDELRRYHSDGPAKYVIEVNRGFANRTGVESGTRVEFRGNRTLLTPEE